MAASSSSSIKPSSRYASFDSRSSTNSNPSSSSELKSNKHSNPLKRFISGNGGGASSGGSAMTARRNSPHGVSKPHSSDLIKLNPVKKEQNLSAMVKKFMEKKAFSSTSSSSSKANRKAQDGGTANELAAAADLLAVELKKPAKKASGFTTLQRKLFNKGSSEDKKSEVKALTEVHSNARTLAMVLRSERDLLSQNKELESESQQIALLLQEKNTEVEKLKDLCLAQREEITRLKNAILFPDVSVSNTQLQDLFEKQGSELRQAKQVIPDLQTQVTSLTSQLQCLAEGLAEMKADKIYSQMGFEDHISSPMTPTYDQEVDRSLVFSSGDYTTPRSSDEMFVKDLNPLLTPYAKTRSKEFRTMLNDDNPPDERLSDNNVQVHQVTNNAPNARKLWRSPITARTPVLGELHLVQHQHLVDQMKTDALLPRRCTTNNFNSQDLGNTDRRLSHNRSLYPST